MWTLTGFVSLFKHLSHFSFLFLLHQTGWMLNYIAFIYAKVCFQSLEWMNLFWQVYSRFCSSTAGILRLETGGNFRNPCYSWRSFGYTFCTWHETLMSQTEPKTRHFRVVIVRYIHAHLYSLETSSESQKGTLVKGQLWVHW